MATCVQCGCHYDARDADLHGQHARLEVCLLNLRGREKTLRARVAELEAENERLFALKNASDTKALDYMDTAMDAHRIAAETLLNCECVRLRAALDVASAELDFAREGEKECAKLRARVAELTGQVERIQAAAKVADEVYARGLMAQRARIAELEAALRWYADKVNYQQFTWNDGVEDNAVSIDFGDRARAALAKGRVAP